jgi:hypothetical protein
MPVMMAPRHRRRLPVRLQSLTAEEWLFTLFPIVVCGALVLLGWGFFPRRCGQCGRRALVRAQTPSAHPRKMTMLFTFYWCFLCSARLKTRDGVTWLDASSQEDSFFYGLWKSQRAVGRMNSIGRGQSRTS